MGARTRNLAKFAGSTKDNLITDIGILALRTAIADNSAAHSLTKYHINTFETDTGFTKTNTNYNIIDEVYSSTNEVGTDITGSDSDGFDDSDFRVSTGGTVTLTATITSGIMSDTTGDRIIDGSGDSTANIYFQGSTVDATITFDAGANKKIDWQGVRIIGSTEVDHGTFVAEASNDNSSYTTLKSAFTLQNMSSAQRTNGGSGREATWSNSTGYRYFRLRRTAGSGSSSPWIYYFGFKWTTLTTGSGVSATGNILTSSAVATSDGNNTSSIDPILLYRDLQGTNTLNTDLILKVSADNGSNFTTVTLTSGGNYSSTFKIAKAHNVSVTAGSQLKYQILWANQSAGSKEFTVKGIALQYQ